MNLAISTLFVERIIKKYTSDCQQFVDIDALCEGLGIEVKFQEKLPDSVIGDMTQHTQENEKNACTIRIINQADIKMQRTIKALLVAKFFLGPEKLEQQGYRVEIFELKDLRGIRHSRLMYLATRLILPESVIEQIDTNSLNTPSIDALSRYEERFVMCAVKGRTVALIVSTAG